MKKRILMLLSIFPALCYGQTQGRSDAGLQGNAGATSGFFETPNPSNYPFGASSWWHLLDVRHSNPENNYAMQFAGSFFDQNLYFRKTNNSATQPWSRVLTEVNGNSGIGTLAPSSYFHGGNNRVLEIFNPNSIPNSQSHIILSSNSTDAGSSAGSITWITNGAAGNKGLAYVGVTAAANSAVNASGNIYMATANAGTPTIKMMIDYKGDVGIGTLQPNEKLSVNGKIRAHEVKVETANWPDYVFDQDYKILGLQELDAYIKQHKHLPEIPSAVDAEKNGVELGEMNKLLLKKIEELTLHLIEKNEQIKNLEQRVLKLETKK